MINEYQTDTLTLPSPDETAKFGLLLGQTALPGDVICLDGDLGAGKTTLTQAIAKGLEVPDNPPVTSPSFAIFQEYQGRIPLYHFDFYRLFGPDDVSGLGLDEYFYLSGCAVIEWPRRAAGLLPAEYLCLELRVLAAEARQVFCRYHRQRWAARWRSLTEKFALSR
ncbi:MAG: tRNA (adenosine(37)-N6)-threonylcarbamoyltransferase complex ATPase subunit type 1 TsaE [Desulfobulbaceae bacterium]|jgi:tRNA threonylcarbamoyladenosine biosynthesis protein TsaE|nr:tRNA (adenosine(37)-N6)-threonylcarbamoyltransferase complex ATPase subunit type 1 TsaE [Desulfobulbaceae bacterium]